MAANPEKVPLADVPRNNAIKYIDQVSKVLHNPMVTCASLVLCYGYFGVYANIDWVNKQDCWMDILSLLINIVFIARFSCFYKFPFLLELALFVVQNLACFNLFVNRNYSLLYNDSLSPQFKVCLIVQIVFPYVLLVVNLYDYSTCSQFLFNCNNNYLPIFISHSFVFVNYLPLESSHRLMVLLFKFSQYSFKFYLIYQYFMHEIASIVFETENFSDYSVFYSEVATHNKKSSWRDYVNHLMIGSCVAGVLFNICILAYKQY